MSLAAPTDMVELTLPLAYLSSLIAEACDTRVDLVVVFLKAGIGEFYAARGIRKQMAWMFSARCPGTRKTQVSTAVVSVFLFPPSPFVVACSKNSETPKTRWLLSVSSLRLFSPKKPCVWCCAR